MLKMTQAHLCEMLIAKLEQNITGDKVLKRTPHGTKGIGKDTVDEVATMDPRRSGNKQESVITLPRKGFATASIWL